MTAYKNKWEDWTCYWFYHKVPLDSATGTHPLVVKQIQNLPSTTPSVNVEEFPEHRALVDMLREVSKVFSTRVTMEEFVACCCWPVSDGWSVLSWKEPGSR